MRSLAESTFLGELHRDVILFELSRNLYTFSRYLEFLTMFYLFTLKNEPPARTQ
jgi:hypothetical protein